MSSTGGPAPLQRIRGTNDFLPPQDARLRALEASLRDRFELYGYEGIQTPVIEPLDLFLRKSGDAIVARMYAFSHWNRQLSLRPELTASTMRAYVNELQGRSLPLRLHYGGPTFRYERPSRARHRQFTEVGIELIGAAGPAADAEVLHLACEGLERTGVTSYRLVVGHLGVLLEMLRQVGMSEHAQGLLLDQMEPLVRGRVDPEATVSRIVDLLGGSSEDGDGGEVGALAELPPDQATAIAAELLRRSSLPLEGGSRTPAQIIGRLLSRASRPDPTAQVRAAVDFVLELHAASGERDQLQAMREIIERHGLSTNPLREVEAALDLLAASRNQNPEARWEVDLSLARGLRYYTGLVFEIYVDREDGPLQVSGGGRYDDLIEALGGRQSVPACGFAYGLERVDMVRDGSDGMPEPRPHLLVVAVGPEDYASAVVLASELRATGSFVVEQDVRLRGPKAALRHADRSKAAAVLIVGERERLEGMVVVRDMHTRAERRVPRSRALEAVEQLRR